MNFSVLFSSDVKIFFPEVFLAFALLILLVYGVLTATSSCGNFPLISKNVSFYSCFVMFITFLLTLNIPVDYALIFQKTFVHDDLSRIVKLSVLFASFCTLILSQSYTQFSCINNFEYFLLIMFSVFGILLLVSSSDLLSAYVAIELQTLAFCILACFQRRSVFSTEAGLKYFILGAISSGLLLYGFSLVYGVVGTTNLINIKSFCIDTEFEGSGILSIAIVFLITGFLFKIAAFPFHIWSPDVYEGAPTSATVFFAIVPKIAVLTFFVRLFFFGFFSFVGVWDNLLTFSAIGSIFYSAFVAMKQDSLKRLLAYSSIGHVGYILLPLAICTTDGIQALFFYSLVYILISIPAWGAVIACMNGRKSSQNSITNLSGLPVTSPVLGIVCAMSFFSLAGVPPLVGFYSKIFVFFCAIKSSYYLIASGILVVSVISTFYYISVVKTVYFEKNKHWILYKSITKEKSILLAISFFFLLFFFFCPSMLLLLSQKMVLSVI